jgi:hypothetical protein
METPDFIYTVNVLCEEMGNEYRFLTSCKFISAAVCICLYCDFFTLLAIWSVLIFFIVLKFPVSFPLPPPKIGIH